MYRSPIIIGGAESKKHVFVVSFPAGHGYILVVAIGSYMAPPAAPQGAPTVESL
jgi:hypothetical protein